MAKLGYGKEVMLKVIDERPDWGKTAIMKMMYILQRLFGVRLGHTFSIYTHGVYASTVTDEQEQLIYAGYVDAEVYEYKESLGYKLRISEKGKKVISAMPAGALMDEDKIVMALELFREKSARDLELDSTIIYVKCQYQRHGWPTAEQDVNDIIESVCAIKPHFSSEEIKDAYDRLKDVLPAA